jgi:hypothetical protein
MKTISFSKTFQKGEDAIPEILDFVMSKVETEPHDDKGNLSEFLESLEETTPLKFKYVVSVRKFYL